MSGLQDPHAGTPAPTGTRGALRPAVVILGLCLVAGVAGVIWRAMERADFGRISARTEALAAAAALELHLNQAGAAGELVAALSRQAGGPIPDFQRVASDLLAAHPALATIELAPGGVVSDIVPRNGYERAIGFNVLKDPAQQAGATAALQGKVLTVCGPLPLYHGEAGVVARAPIYLKGRDNREHFWGFAGVSLRLSEAVSHANLPDLPRRGYNYSLLAPAASARQKPIRVAGTGVWSLADAVKYPVRIQNLEWQLALEPQTGWVNMTKVLIDSLGVLLVSGLVFLIAALLEVRRETEAVIQDQKQQLAAEVALRKQAQTEFQSAKTIAAAAQAEIQQIRDILKRGQVTLTETQARLEVALQNATEVGVAAQTRQADLDQAQTSLQQAQEEINRIRQQLAAAEQAAEESAANEKKLREQAQASIVEWQDRIAKASQAEQEARRSAADRLAELKQREEELRAARSGIALAETHAAKLAERLRRAEAELKAREKILADPPAPTPEPPAMTIASEPEIAIPEEPPAPEPEAENPPPISAPPIADPPAVLPEPAPVFETPVAEAPAEIASLEEPTEPAVAPVTPSPIELAEAAIASAIVPETAEGIPSSPTPQDKNPKPARRKKSRRDDQMDLFESPAAAPVPDESTADKEATRKPVERRATEPPPPPVDVSMLRKAVNQILPLLMDGDPGAKDCLRDHRTTFRSAFSADAFPEFEQSVKQREYSGALEQLRKAVKKHGIIA